MPTLRRRTGPDQRVVQRAAVPHPPGGIPLRPLKALAILEILVQQQKRIAARTGLADQQVIHQPDAAGFIVPAGIDPDIHPFGARRHNRLGGALGECRFLQGAGPAD